MRLLYSQTLDLTFTAHDAVCFGKPGIFQALAIARVRDGVTPASKSAWVFFIKALTPNPFTKHPCGAPRGRGEPFDLNRHWRINIFL